MQSILITPFIKDIQNNNSEMRQCPEIRVTASKFNPFRFKPFFNCHDGIAALEKWFEEIGTPTRLEQLNIKEADLPAIVENVQINVKAFGIASDYRPKVVTEILMHVV